jgi:hypothetical protein
MIVIAVLLAALLFLLPKPDAGIARTGAGEGRGESEPSQPIPETPLPEERTPEAPTPAPPAPADPLPTQPAPSEEREPPPVRGRVSIVIDDVGNDIAALRPFLDLPGAVTFAVLPQRRHSVESSQMIRRAGKEVILHLPMEPLGDQNPGQGAVFVDYSPAKIQEVIEQNLATVPGAVGANNHMGSRATAEPLVMSALFSVLSRRGLFFLDSRTTADTVGATAARRQNVPYLERTVFIDNNRDEESIRSRIREGLAVAEERGHAVMIGHVTVSRLADVLKDMYPDMVEDGYALYTLSEMVLHLGADYARVGN